MFETVKALGEWFGRLKWTPDNPVEIVLLVITSIGAWRLANRTNRIAEAEQTPVLTLELRDDDAFVKNAGPGIALNTCVTDREAGDVIFLGTIAPGESVRVDIKPTLSETYRLYCQSILRSAWRRRWLRSDVLFQNPLGQRRVLAGRFNRRVTLVPNKVRAALSTEDFETMFVRMERRWDPRNWPRRAQPHWRRFVSWCWTIYYAEHVRLYDEKFATRQHVSGTDPGQDTRSKWPVDIRGFVRCAGSILYHYACSSEDAGDLVLDVGFDLVTVESGGWGELRGWVLIRAATMRSLEAMPRDDRDNELHRRFSVEFCRRRPRRSFLVVL